MFNPSQASAWCAVTEPGALYYTSLSVVIAVRYIAARSEVMYTLGDLLYTTLSHGQLCMEDSYRISFMAHLASVMGHRGL